MNYLNTNTHEDERRKMTEWVIDFPVRNIKVIEVKVDCVLGNHVHNKKSEIFFLFKGNGSWIVGDETLEYHEGECIMLHPGNHHAFHLKAGSILFEAATHPYDPNDEIR